MTKAMKMTKMVWISSTTAALPQQLSDSASPVLPCYINAHILNYTVSQKKRPTFKLSLTLSNLN